MEEIMKTELDPCCMREILDRKKANSIKGKLRRYDRSKKRIDMKNGVITDLKALNRHTCMECVNPKDYEMLIMIRNQANVEGEDNNGDGTGDVIENEEEDSDFDDFDDFVSDLEIEMRNKIQMQQREKDEFQHVYGFGFHRYDSVTHLQLSIQLGYPVVLHICDPSSIACAYVDVALEKCAAVYVGTKFRRIYCSDHLRYCNSVLQCVLQCR